MVATPAMPAGYRVVFSVSTAIAAIIWLGLSDLLFFHIKLYFYQLTTHQYILRRRAGETELVIAASALCHSKVSKIHQVEAAEMHAEAREDAFATLQVSSQLKRKKALKAVPSFKSSTVVPEPQHYQAALQQPLANGHSELPELLFTVQGAGESGGDTPGIAGTRPCRDGSVTALPSCEPRQSWQSDSCMTSSSVDVPRYSSHIQERFT